MRATIRGVLGYVKTPRVREDKPVYGLDTTITNQDGVVVLDGSVVVWRDPVVATEVARKAAGRPLS